MTQEEKEAISRGLNYSVNRTARHYAVLGSGVGGAIVASMIAPVLAPIGAIAGVAWLFYAASQSSDKK